ncbi:MAG: terminase family protein [Opitutaceae bacterium]|nr:terminase family protein [Opitutaceae bacterium]
MRKKLIISPRDILLPYQRAWSDDRARFKAGLWSRQTGKDFSSAEEIVRDCLTRAKTTWLIAAPSERQSIESLAKCREWSEAYKLAITDARIVNESSNPEALLKSSEIIFANGARVVAVPGRPDTVRGFSANALLTEFAFFEDDDATWRAILPSITNPLRGGEKKIRIISTPNGRQGRFFKIIDENLLNPVPGRKMVWSCHKVTIHEAVRLGLPVDIDQIREGMDDAEGFAQEFECEFLDSSNVLLPYDIIGLAESAEATEFGDPAFWDVRAGNPVVLGIDFGRTNDPTICWALERIGDIWWTREVLVLKGMSSPAQQTILSSRIKRAGRVCFDNTGPGIGLGDHLVQEHGEYDPAAHKFGRIELDTFTAGFKREIFPKLRRAFEAPVKLRIPVSKAVREDLHEMRQIVRNGEYTYAAPHTAEGHSDRCTALALALRATAASAGPFAFRTVPLFSPPSTAPGPDDLDEPFARGPRGREVVL